jgi:acetoin utilization deacetylase AcuC-like enzyme
MNKTGFFTSEKCFWHGGGNYAQLVPVGGWVQPMVSGGLPESPESKRRFRNLLEASGLLDQLEVKGAEPLTLDQMQLVHGRDYLQAFKALSEANGGELGLRTPFGPGAFEIAGLSAGLVFQAVRSVLSGDLRNAYALARPPGHHCLPDWPNGFCLLNNIAIAIELARDMGLADRFAVVDWDVHHGNGTEAIFYDRPDVLTISVHQSRCYPFDTGEASDRGAGKGLGYNVNIPLQPGGGHLAYLQVMDQIILPKLAAFDADLVIVACGFDASGVDPLSRMLCTSETFRAMTQRLMELTKGKLVMAHEGGYSEVHVPFCGHAVMEALSGSTITVQDPLLPRLQANQPSAEFAAHHSALITEMARFHLTQ